MSLFRGTRALVFLGAIALGACSSSTPGTDGGLDAGIPDGSCDRFLPVDPCPEGRYCALAGPTDPYGTCQLPAELDIGCAIKNNCGGAYCVPDAGCNAPGLICQNSFPLEDGGPGTTSVCVYDCNQTADCAAIDTSCVMPPLGGHQLCFFNYCGPASNPPNGAGFYLPCDSGGPLKNDALCIPRDDPNGPGRCEASGNAPLGSACQLTRMNGSTDALCQLGSKCRPGTSGPNRCMQICAATGTLATAPDGGPGCADPTDYCFNEFNTPWGYCVQKCSLTGGGSCPTGTQCTELGGNAYGCLP